MNSIPTGLVTFLFTDIEGSTRLAQEFPESYPTALEDHNNILKNSVESNNGFVFDIVGDAFYCSFENPFDAIKASVSSILDLAKSKIGIKVRIGIDTGKANWNGVTYAGYITLARTHRIMSAASGDQIIISDDVLKLLRNIFENEKRSELEFSYEKNKNKISFRDLGERRLKDLLTPVKLFQVVSEILPANFTPLKTLDVRPNNLPVMVTNFIGREKEISRIKEELEKSRLLTLTGTGGAGKTRLALQIGMELTDNFIHGVWITELESLPAQSFLPQSILKIFYLKEEQNKNPVDTLIEYLKDKNILLILDNCEHVIEQCSKLSDNLLSKCPGLKILATSRELLRCKGETAHRVLSLEIPDLKGEITFEKIKDYESVRLFIERAQAVRPDFNINNENAFAIAEICSKLDGIPLAIELAAARTKVLTLEKINEKLKDRFHLLTGGSRTVLPRQQTLKALIDWSYDLLNEKEKLLWERLSIFKGGLTLDAAENVCSDSRLNEQEILYILNNLSEKSIIIFDFNKGRYKMLESISQYGKEKLNQSGERKNVFSKYLRHFSELTKNAEPNLFGKDGKVWLGKIEDDYSNIQYAVEGALSNNEFETAAQMASELRLYWDIRGYYSSGMQVLELILKEREKISKNTLGKILLSSGSLLFLLGRSDESKKHYEEALRLQRETDDQEGITNTLNGLGNVEILYGNYGEAKKFYTESLETGKRIELKRVVGMALNNLGNVEYITGNFDEAMKLYEQCLEYRKQSNDNQGVATAFCNLGNLCIEQGKYDLSQKYLTMCVDVCRELGERKLLAHAFIGLSSLKFIQGKYDEAKQIMFKSIELNREMGDKRGLTKSFNNLGSMEFDFGNFSEAEKLFNEGYSIALETGEKSSIADSLSYFGDLQYIKKNYEMAHEYYRKSLLLRNDLGEKINILKSIKEFVGIAAVKKDFRQGVMLLGLCESIGHPEKSHNVTGNKILDKARKILNENLSEKDYAKYLEEGKKMTLEEAVNTALDIKICSEIKPN